MKAPKNPNFAADVQSSFDGQSMMQALNASLTNVEPGAIEISAGVPDGFGQQQGFAHGGVAFSLSRF